MQFDARAALMNYSTWRASDDLPPFAEQLKFANLLWLM